MPQRSLMLIPGLCCDAEVWAHQRKYLSDSVDEIVIPDLSGADTPQRMLDAVMQNAPENFSLAGHSLGGWVALEVMKHVPERVEKLCLLSTTADVDSDAKRQSRLKLISEVEKGNFDQVVEDLLDLFVWREELRNSVREMLLRNEHAFINQQRALMARESSFDALKEIEQPVLLILGRDDLDFPAETQEIARALPDGRLVWIENCGHMSPMEQPEAVTALLRYWIEYL